MITTQLQTTIRKSIYQLLATVDSAVGRKLPMVTILCYHGIDSSGWYHSISLSEFEKQITALAKTYRFISLPEVLEYISGKKIITEPSICITFDDGYKSIVSAQKILKKYSITPTVFVLSDTKNVNRAEMENQLPLLSEKEIKELQKTGWEVGCHTATHPDLKTISTAELTKEIVESKKTIEKMTDLKCNYIAYPKGRYTPEVLKITEKSKYSLGLSMDDGIISTSTPKLAVPRIGVNASHSVSELLASLSPTNTTFRKTIKTILA